MVKSLIFSKLEVPNFNFTMYFRPLDQLAKVIENAFSGVTKLRKNFKTFFIEAMILFIAIPKRVNFTQMSRFGDSCESRFRQNFQKPFDWIGYNSAFVGHTDGHRRAIAIDPSYIDKSGKCTPGTAYYWSGCASSAKWGLELLEVAIVDIDTRETIHLKAVQTVDTVKPGRPPAYLSGFKDPNSLAAWYLKCLAKEKTSLLKICKLVVADAYFSKAPFVNGIVGLGFNLVSRFRNDVRLRYIYTGPKTGKRGRPKTVDGKVDLSSLRMDVFTEEHIDMGEGKETVVYSAVVWATSLKRKVKVAVVDCMEPGKKTQTRKVFFSTHTEMSATDIVETYRVRFQIEFLLRDAKQFTGLTHCQSRKKASIGFAFNMSLTAINVARAFARDNDLDLSVANVKTLVHNAMMMRRILSMSGIPRKRLLNSNDFKDLLYYGVATRAS